MNSEVFTDKAPKAIGPYSQAISALSVNYSHPDIKCFELFREALPKAIADAKTGIYKQPVIDFFKGVGSKRGQSIIDRIK